MRCQLLVTCWASLVQPLVERRMTFSAVPRVLAVAVLCLRRRRSEFEWLLRVGGLRCLFVGWLMAAAQMPGRRAVGSFGGRE